MEALVNYVAAALLILVIVLGFTTYIFHEGRARAMEESVVLTGKLRESEANVLLAQKSCIATQVITADVAEDIEVKQTVMTKTLEALATVSTIVPPETTTNEAKKYADDAKLSPDLMRLLDQSFCGAFPSDTSCTASGASKAVSGGKSKK